MNVGNYVIDEASSLVPGPNFDKLLGGISPLAWYAYHSRKPEDKRPELKLHVSHNALRVCGALDGRHNVTEMNKLARWKGILIDE